MTSMLQRVRLVSLAAVAVCVIGCAATPETRSTDDAAPSDSPVSTATTTDDAASNGGGDGPGVGLGFGGRRGPMAHGHETKSQDDATPSADSAAATKSTEYADRDDEPVTMAKTDGAPDRTDGSAADAASDPDPDTDAAEKVTPPVEDLKPPTGAYRTASASSMMLFREGRYVLGEDGRCVGGGVFHIDGNQVTLTDTFGEARTYDGAWSGDTLTLSQGGTPRIALSAVDKTPDWLAVEPLKLPAAQAVVARRVDDMQSELTSKRKAWRDATKRGNADKAAQLARDNGRWLRTLVLELGWLDAERFGKVYSQFALLIAETAGDQPLLEAALPLVEADARAGRFDAELCAQTIDAHRLATGRPQRYGTQTAARDGKTIVRWLAAPAGVDQRRKQIGLAPIRRSWDNAVIVELD